MTTFRFLGIVVLASFAVFLTSGIWMLSWLEKRAVKINYWLLRFLIFRYARQYKTMSLEETGRIGTPYRVFYSAFTVMISAAAVILLARLGL
jgi:hypothetical protein